MKPLGIKNYGSIPHLPGSRTGPADYHCHEGQARIACEKSRDSRDTIIVQEKLDGSNVGVANVDGQILALVRAGYLASTSPHEFHHRFVDWVGVNADRFRGVLDPGERIVGEWLLQAHGTRYDLPHEPFVAFDLMIGSERTPWQRMHNRLTGIFRMPALLSVGAPVSIEDAISLLGTYGHHGALDPVEGAVWRVERDGKVDFLVKYVRADKVDGCYLESVTGGGGPVWNTWQDCV